MSEENIVLLDFFPSQKNCLNELENQTFNSLWKYQKDVR